jgi:hypothetical protein
MAESVNTVDARMLDCAVAVVLVEGWHPSKKQNPIAIYLIVDPPLYPMWFGVAIGVSC